MVSFRAFQVIGDQEVKAEANLPFLNQRGRRRSLVLWLVQPYD